MVRLQGILRSLLYIAGIFVLASIGFETIRISSDLHSNLKASRNLIESARGTSMQIHTMAQAFGKQADAQAKYTITIESKTAKLLTDSDKTILRLDKVAAQAQLLVAHSDNQVNGSILPQLSENLKSLNDSLKQIKPILDTVNKQVDNPDIAGTITNARLASANMVSITGHANGATQNLEAISADSKAVADHYKKVLTAPTTPIKAAFNFIANWFARFLGSAI